MPRVVHSHFSGRGAQFIAAPKCQIASHCLHDGILLSYLPVSKKRYPLRVARGAHGIRAQDLRTLARTVWWARRWIASLEAMRLGPRFGRGRQYAVAGQVTELVLEGPHVEATVVGSREAPYRLTLDFTTPDSAARERIAAAIAAEPMMLGRLLTDDLPTEIESLFRTEGIPLFPQAEPLVWSPTKSVYDVKMHCSCPDWARPCKHLVAVMLLLGEEIAQRPTTLLSLRGIEVEDLVLKIEDLRLKIKSSTPQSPILNPQSSIFNLQSSISNHQSSILKRLGPIPFWRGTVRCVDSLARIYGRCQPVAADASAGKSIDLRG